MSRAPYPSAPMRKAAFQLLRSRPREVALQVLFQDDLNPGLDSGVGEELLRSRLRLGQFLQFGQDELLEADDEIQFDNAGLSPFGREELVQAARELVRDFSEEDLRAMSREELAHLVQNDAVEFARRLVNGVRERRQELDATLSGIAENWSLARMSATDRNVLRLGAYELLYTDTPPRVAVDEAVELAKRFGAAQSGPFVNGILDRVLHKNSS